MVLITENDPRGPKAVALATDAGQWLKCRARDGRKAYGVPSSEAGRYYLVTRGHCTCPDFSKRGFIQPCKHMLAVQLHCELVQAESHPVLDMVRHPDGEISWERSHRHTPIDAETARLAAKYDEIMSRFNDETPEQIMGRL
jgi:hypothetical protein